MLRKIYLEGEIGDKFGSEFELDVPNFRDAILCIDCNVEGFKNYLLECDQKGIGFILDVAGKPLEDAEHMLINLKEGDMTMTPMPAGAKSGGAKILAAVAIIAISYFTFGAGGWLAGGGVGGGGATFGAAGGVSGAISTGTAATIANIGYAIGINLALAGIQQLMAPDPATDSGREESYLFNGSEQNILEGDPVPVLYGELRVPGRPISFELLNTEFVEVNANPFWRGFGNSGIRI